MAPEAASCRKTSSCSSRVTLQLFAFGALDRPGLARLFPGLAGLGIYGVGLRKLVDIV